MKIALDAVAEHLDRARLGEPRRALDEQVAVGQDRDQQALEQVALTDDLGRQRLFQVQYFLLQQGGVLASRSGMDSGASRAP